MRIEFLKHHGGHSVGTVVDHPHPGVADALVRRGIARLAPVASVGAGQRGEPKAPAKPKKVTRK